MFNDWLRNKSIGIDPVDIDKFTSNNEYAILDASDRVMMEFAKLELNYNRSKGLDLVARFNKKYIIGEAKFLTDMGGHQHTQFDDAIATIEERNVKAIQIAILDGVLYIPCGSKMYRNVEPVPN